ncbi:MAG: hypothetical protein B6245_17560 [Desulfobacteraceae bacterium 4572_88]|nr:MAG: hypothetical protein B6245_17560 [Desulfobacteraceae bacterium 4572_88]
MNLPNQTNSVPFIAITACLLLVGGLLSACIPEPFKRPGLENTTPSEMEKPFPHRLAVLPPIYETERSASYENPFACLDKLESDFLLELIRGVTCNHLIGKGYEVIPANTVDRMLTEISAQGESWKTEGTEVICEKLSVQGIIRITVHHLTCVKAHLVYNNFSIGAGIRLTDASGNNIRKWDQTASAQKLSLPTGPVSAAAALVEAIAEEPAGKQMRYI